MEPFVGQIQAFGFNFAPRGWSQCAGQLLSIAQNTALFSLLGTTYGGNGQTTFALPDLRGRAAIGQGQGPGLSNYVIGEAAGSETVTMLSTQMPQHTHAAVATPHTHTSPVHTHVATATSTLYGERAAGNLANPAGNMMASSANMYIAPQPANNVALDAGAITSAVTNADTAVTIDATTVTVTNGATGGGQPLGILSPFLCVNMCIATEGIFPPRN